MLTHTPVWQLFVRDYLGEPVPETWILLKQETVSGSGISWAICECAPCSAQITTPTPHHSVFTAGCPSCCLTNSVKALKAFNVQPLNVNQQTGQSLNVNATVQFVDRTAAHHDVAHCRSVSTGTQLLSWWQAALLQAGCTTAVACTDLVQGASLCT